MNLALTRTELGRVRLHWPRPVVSRNVGELASKIVIVTLFSSMAMRLGADAARTGHVTGILLLASEALVVALTLVRRTAATVDRSWWARLLTAFSTFGPPLVPPTPTQPPTCPSSTAGARTWSSVAETPWALLVL